MKHCCRNCHFLAREYPADSPRHRDDVSLVGDKPKSRRRSWTKEERETGQMKHEAIASPMCHKGIWDAGINPELNSKLEEIIDKNRKNDCFFIEYSAGMSFDGATELHRIRYENRNLKRSLIIAVIGLYISAGAALLNFIGFENFEKFLKMITDQPSS